jgi:flagellar motor switch/type III secretory pathway protein FliN
MRVSAYPWGSLERLPRVATREATRARRAVARAVRVAGLAKAATEVIHAETELVFRDVTLDVPAVGGDTVALELADGSRVWVRMEPALVSELLSRVLGRGVGLTPPGATLEPALAGALAAVLIEIARRSGAPEPLCSAPARPPTATAVVHVAATVLLEGRPYAVSAWVAPDATAGADGTEVDLAALGELPVAVPLVGGLCLADPGELAALGRGDAWLFGSGAFVDASGAGRAALAGPLAERGVAVTLASDGSVVVGDQVVELLLDGEGDMSGSKVSEGAMADAVLDAPVLVRVEIGAVSMTAREWAELQPGDVIETGRRINEPVVLRVAGREVARGELVEIEGELGVRVRELSTGGRG